MSTEQVTITVEVPDGWILTGEYRVAVKGEWYINRNGGASQWPYARTRTKVFILRGQRKQEVFSMFLVVLRHSMDDIPVAIYGSRGEAEQRIASLSWDVSDWHREHFHSDASTPISMGVMQFDCKGQPVHYEAVRSFEDEHRSVA